MTDVTRTSKRGDDTIRNIVQQIELAIVPWPARKISSNSTRMIELLDFCASSSRTFTSLLVLVLPFLLRSVSLLFMLLRWSCGEETHPYTSSGLQTSLQYLSILGSTSSTSKALIGFEQRLHGLATDGHCESDIWDCFKAQVAQLGELVVTRVTQHRFRFTLLTNGRKIEDDLFLRSKRAPMWSTWQTPFQTQKPHSAP